MTDQSLHLITPTHSRAPGPKGHWLLGSALTMRDNAVNFFMEISKEYGDVVQFRLGPMTTFLIRQPEHIRHVLMDNARNYNKQTPGFQQLAKVLGYGLVTSDGELWKTQRRIIQPAFHRKRIEAFADAMIRATTEIVEEWKEHAGTGRVLDVDEEMMRLTLHIVGETLFGQGSTDGDAKSVAEAVTVVQSGVNKRIYQLFPLPLKIPTPHNIVMRNAIQTLDDVVLTMVRERRASGEVKHDLLGMLLEAKDEETGKGMSDGQLRDEVMTMFLAGHETTSNTMVWTWHLLSRNPDVQRKLYKEVSAVLGKGPLTLDRLSELKYTRCVLMEAMRIYPPVWGFARMTVEDDVIGGYPIPKGAAVFMSQWVTQRMAEIWPNPEGFDPSRWEDDPLASLPKFAYFPFGGGARQCIGNNFAMMEATIILVIIVQSYRLYLQEGHSVAIEPLVTVRPKHGLHMTIEPQPT